MAAGLQPAVLQGKKMLKQNIDALKLTTAMVNLQRNDANNPRMSLLDLQIFLTIQDHPDNGKNGLLEIINGSTSSKSFLDRPIDRLISYKLIKRTEHENVATINNGARITYSISEGGEALLKSCRVGG